MCVCIHDKYVLRRVKSFYNIFSRYKQLQLNLLKERRIIHTIIPIIRYLSIFHFRILHFHHLPFCARKDLLHPSRTYQIHITGIINNCVDIEKL